MNKPDFLVAAIGVLCDLMEGAQFEDEGTMLDFRRRLLENGYDADHLLEDVSIYEAFHILCSDLAAIPFSEIKKEHENECT